MTMMMPKFMRSNPALILKVFVHTQMIVRVISIA